MSAPSPPPFISNPSQDAGPEIVGATLAATLVALVTVVARLYVRIFMIRSFGWDDAVMTFAMALTVGAEGVVIASVHYGGVGKHLGDIPLEKIGIGMKLNFVTQPLYLWSIMCIKVAVGITLLRIAASKPYRIAILSILYTLVVYTIICVLTIVFQCTDIRIVWDPTIKATCWGKTTLQALSYLNMVISIATDLLLAIVIPVPMLWSLNVNRRTRATLIGILALGLFGCVAAMVKSGYLANYGVLGDWLWDSREITIWTVNENCTGIVAGSLPALRPLFKKVLGSVISRTGYARGGYGTGTGHSRTAGSSWTANSSSTRKAKMPIVKMTSIKPSRTIASPRATTTDRAVKRFKYWSALANYYARGNATSTYSDPKPVRREMLDDASSQRALNMTWRDQYELDDSPSLTKGPALTNTAFTVAAYGNSDDSLDMIIGKLPIQGIPEGVITKTTTTTVVTDAKPKPVPRVAPPIPPMPAFPRAVAPRAVAPRAVTPRPVVPRAPMPRATTPRRPPVGAPRVAKG